MQSNSRSAVHVALLFTAGTLVGLVLQTQYRRYRFEQQKRERERIVKELSERIRKAEEQMMVRFEYTQQKQAPFH